MQEYTRLKAEELKGDLIQKLQDEWMRIASEWAQFNSPLPDSGLFWSIREAGINYLNKYIGELCGFEKKALQKKAIPTKDYFDTLITEFTILSEPIFDEIKKKPSNMICAHEFKNITDLDREKELINKIAQKVKILQEDIKIDSSQISKPHLGKVDLPPFDFIQIKELMPIFRRDYQEVLLCREKECWKAAIILCGSLIEGILYDLLKQNEERALQSKEAQKDKSAKILPIEDWYLTYLINTASNLNLIEKGIKGLHHTTKDYRNLVHPINEIRSSYKLKKEEADNAFAILNMLIRDLTEEWKKKFQD